MKPARDFTNAFYCLMVLVILVLGSCAGILMAGEKTSGDAARFFYAVMPIFGMR